MGSDVSPMQAAPVMNGGFPPMSQTTPAAPPNVSAAPAPQAGADKYALLGDLFSTTDADPPATVTAPAPSTGLNWASGGGDSVSSGPINWGGSSSSGSSSVNWDGSGVTSSATPASTVSSGGVSWNSSSNSTPSGFPASTG